MTKPNTPDPKRYLVALARASYQTFEELSEAKQFAEKAAQKDNCIVRVYQINSEVEMVQQPKWAEAKAGEAS